MGVRLDHLDLGTLDAPPRRAKQKADEKACERCAKPIPRRHASSRRFCGRSCAAAMKAEKTRKPRTNCVCGKPARTVRHKSCCKAHGYLMRKLSRMKPLTCPVCAQLHWPKGKVRWKYCSMKCYDKVRTAKAFEEFHCAKCQRSVRRRKVRTRPREFSFCSRACAKGFRAGPLSPVWRGGSDPNRGRSWLKIAESIRLRDGHTCQRCGKTQQENGQKLSVDHIRPWRSFDDEHQANDPSNLVSVCRSCHTKKTTGAERQWLQGDVLAMEQYIRSVTLPSAVVNR